MSGKPSPGARPGVAVVAVLVVAITGLVVATARSSFATHVEPPLTFTECQSQLGFDLSGNTGDERLLVDLDTATLEQTIEHATDVL